MKEFGSDFHYLDTYHSSRAHLTDVYGDATLLGDGRQCVVSLIRQYGWKRLWMPAYFCHEVIGSLRSMTGIDVVLYHDHPLLGNDQETIEGLPFTEGDALFRVNYFGIRDFRSSRQLPVPVVEDHTHDLLGHWALYSDADWCIASLRKSLPLPEGGMMWSPKSHVLTSEIPPTAENDAVAGLRWEGMRMKADYLNGTLDDKQSFRQRFLDTEEWFDRAEVSAIEGRSRAYVDNLDINKWQVAKHRNWQLLKDIVNKDHCRLIEPEDESCTMFSLILLFDSREYRDAVRKRLIADAVYPAVLWTLPRQVTGLAKDFSERMLSVHCDGRYTELDVLQLAGILNKALENR